MSDFSIERLAPLGVQVTARGHTDVSSVDSEALAKLAQTEKLVVLRGFSPLSRDEFLSFCLRYPASRLLEWDFGPVMEMRETPDPKNYLFSRERVPFHWDGAFYREPNYLVFSCVAAPTQGCGGETLFCDTERIWNDSSELERQLWSGVTLRYETAKLAHYGGTISNPLVKRHPATGHPILRFAEPVTTSLNPVTLAIDGIEKGLHEEFVANLTERIYHPNYCYRHVWNEGDLLLADNHALIHGRSAFKEDCPRHLRRIQLI